MALVAVPIVSAILGGMATNLGALTTLGAVAAFAAAVVSPPVGLLVLAFMGPLKPPEIIPAPGFNFLLVGALVMGCIYRLPIDQPRLRLSAPLLLLLAFFLYVFVQQTPELLAGYAGVEPHRIGFQFLQFAACVGAVLTAGYVLRDNRPYVYLGAALAATCLAAILALGTYDTGGAGTPFGGLIAQVDDGSRAVGPFGNPNYFGSFLATAIVAALGWALIATRPIHRVLLLSVASLAGAAVVLSLSRGGMAALLAGLACLALLRNRVLGVGLIVAGIIGVAVVYPLFVEWRIGTATGPAYTELQASDSTRLDALLAGPQLFLSEPLFGVGFGQYSALSARFTETHISIGAHNWYMNVLAEQGLVGIVLWVLFLGSVALELRSRPQSARSIGFGVLTAYVVGSLFTTQPVSFQTSVVAIFVLVAALVADWGPGRERKAARTQPGVMAQAGATG